MEQTQASAVIFRTGKGVLWGLAAALLGAVLTTLLFALLLTLGLPDGAAPFLAHLSAALAGGMGGFFGGWKGKCNGLITGLCTGAGLFLIHLALTAVFGTPSLSCLLFLLWEGGGGILGGIAGVNLRRN